MLKFAVKKFNRQLSMQVRGKNAAVIGRVAMQMTVLDVTDIPNVQVGDEVIVPAMRIPTSALVSRVYVE
jgi:alanine racemase